MATHYISSTWRLWSKGNLKDDGKICFWNELSGMFSARYILLSTIRHSMSGLEAGTHQSRPARHWLTTMKYLESHGFSIGKPVWSNRLGALNACRFTRTTWVSFHCLLVSWLEAGHSLSSLFITVTQSGVLGLQWVLINDSSWQLKAFRRMIFQFWAEIQTATQKYHSYISAPPSPLILYPQW